MSCASVLAVLYFLLVAPPSPQPLIFFFQVTIYQLGSGPPWRRA